MGIFSRLFRRGQSITPAQALACISNRPMLMQAGALDALIATAQAMPDRGAYREDGDMAPHGSKPEHLVSVENGIGVLSIEGPLFARFGIESWWYGGSAYDVIGAAFDLLLADAGVTQIVMLIDSPGGTVTGCFELADKIYAARGQKPITAVASDSAYSAAYAIASAADRIVIPRSGGLGSIGVRCQHVDISRALDRIGYTVTTIVSGSKKADFDSTAPLSDSARSEMQDEVNRLADIFVETVARNRGLDADAVRGLQAGCLFGPSAIAAGLGDTIGTIESVGAVMLEQEDAPEDLPDDGEDAATEEARITARLHDAQLKSVALIEELNSLKASAGVDIPGSVELAFTPEDRAKMDRAEVADAISASGLTPALAMALLSPAANVTPDTAAARIAHAKALADICAAAGLPDVAADYATKNTDLETARAQLIAVKAEDGPEIVTAHPAGGSRVSVQSRLDPAGIYERRKAPTP
jgi:signal peptide peptidase SppA